MTHDLKPIEHRLSTYPPYTPMFRQGCACGWNSRWYVHRANALKAATNHQTVSQ